MCSFDRVADVYDETRGGIERGERFARHLHDRLPTSARVIEIGVGTGLVAAPLVELGHTVVGIDLSRNMLDHAAGRVGDLIEGDATVLPVRSGSVDAVVAVWAVHLVPDTDSLMDEIRRVLRQNGLLLLIAAGPEVESNDLTDLAYGLGPALGLGWDRSSSLAPRAADARLEHVADTVLDADEFELTPNERADQMEARIFSSLFDLDDETWADVVQPVIDGLRALPEPDRPRRCVQRHVLSTYRRR